MNALKRKKNLKLLGYIFLLFCSFLSAALGIRLLLDWYHCGADYILEKKFVHIKESPKKYDIIFAGSSYIYRSIKPKVFCDCLKSLGMEFSAYSMSAPGCYAFEVNHYLNMIIDLPKPKRPRYILINLFDMTPEYVLSVMEQNRFINRMNRYHDLNTTYLNIRTILLTDWGLYKKARVIVEHILHFFCNISNVHAGFYLFERYELKPREKKLIVQGCGYEKAFAGNKLYHKDFTMEVFENFFKNHKKYLDEFSNNRGGVQPNSADIFFRYTQFREIEKRGIHVIYIVPPVPYNLRNIHALTKMKGFPPTFFLNNVYKYPKLFKYENRYNQGHLNDRGAEYYSKYLAERFFEFLKTGK